MTNKEAISNIKEIIHGVFPIPEEDKEQALDLAIKALEDIEEWRKLTAVCGFDGYVIYKCRTGANDADSN